MLRRIVIAIVYGVIAFLICLLVGSLLASVGISWVAAIGSFMKEWAALIGLIVAVLNFLGVGPRFGQV